jgi:superfamily II DNA or RNA helicase
MEQMKDHHDLFIEDRREKIRRWLGARAINFTLANSREEFEAHPDSFEIRNYQLEAWANLWDARQTGKQRGFVHLATGLGKTSVAVFDVMKFREEQMAQDPPVIPRVLFVSHMNDISQQAKEDFEHFMPNLETDFFKTGQYDLPDADVTFATFQSLRNELGRFNPEDFEYIIYDEAHHTEADTFKKVREYFNPLFELALTATPGRMDARDMKEYFGEPLYSKTLAEGIAEGGLADVDYHIVFDDIVKQLMEDEFEPKTLKELHELLDVRPRNEIIAKNIRDERHRIGLDNAKTIVFCNDKAHTEEMAELLGGIAYHSGIAKSERSKLLQDYRTDSNQIICTVDMFNEGIDIPDARLVVFLRSTQSGTIFEQQLGRGLRRTSGKGKVSVLDFVANIERIQRIQALNRNIQEHSDQLNQKNTEIIDMPSKDNAESLGSYIHIKYAHFDFDKLVIDLLEKWEALNETSGNSKYTHLSNDELVSLALLIKPNAPLAQTEITRLSKEGEFVSVNAVVNRFGTLTKFHRACGFVRAVTNDDIIKLALELKPSAPLRNPDIEVLSAARKFLSSAALIRRFGSITNFQRACGFDVQDRKDLNAKANDELIMFANTLRPGKPMTYQDVRDFTKAGQFVNMYTLRCRFGSLSAFNEARGLTEVSKRKTSGRYIAAEAKKMTDQDIINLARELKPTGPLSQKEIKALAKADRFVHIHIINNRFGSLTAFHKLCGF